jgi:hypothetical protein
MVVELLGRMPPEPAGKKNRTMKRELDVTASPSPSVERSTVPRATVSEAAYGSVVKFLDGLRGTGIPSDLRKSVRAVASDWLRYVSNSLLYVC